MPSASTAALARTPPDRLTVWAHPLARSASRMACQIFLSPEMDGMTVSVPEYGEWEDVEM